MKIFYRLQPLLNKRFYLGLSPLTENDSGRRAPLLSGLRPEVRSVFTVKTIKIDMMFVMHLYMNTILRVECLQPSPY